MIAKTRRYSSSIDLPGEVDLTLKAMEIALETPAVLARVLSAAMLGLCLAGEPQTASAKGSTSGRSALLQGWMEQRSEYVLRK